jgi:two-component system, NtrC family, response regulator HydG
VRIIASTNRDPHEAVADGHLRQDLYYRLQASMLQVPTLRERREDIPMLVEHFMEMFRERVGRNVLGIEQDALQAMMNHSWPGNVRELANAIEGAFTFTRASQIRLQDLPRTIGASGPVSLPATAALLRSARVPSFAEVERDLIVSALENTGGNKVAAATLLGISRKKLYAKIAKYQLASNAAN